jgi:hypothetical protein
MDNDLHTLFDETALAELNFLNIVHHEEVLSFVTEILKEEFQFSSTDLFVWHLPYSVLSTIFPDDFDNIAIPSDYYLKSGEISTFKAESGLEKTMPYLFYLASLKNPVLNQYFQNHLYIYSNFLKTQAGFKKIDDDILALLIIEIANLLLGCQIKNRHATTYYLDKLELNLLILSSDCDDSGQKSIPGIDTSFTELFRTTSFLASMQYSQLIRLFHMLAASSALPLIECLCSIMIFQQEHSISLISIENRPVCSHDFIYFGFMDNLRAWAREYNENNESTAVIDKIRHYTTTLGLTWNEFIALEKIPDAIMQVHVNHLKSFRPVLDAFWRIEQEDIVIFDNKWRDKTKNQHYLSYLLANANANTNNEANDKDKNHTHQPAHGLYAIFNQHPRLLLSELVVALSQQDFELHEIEKIKHFIFSYDEVRALCFNIQNICR